MKKIKKLCVVFLAVLMIFSSVPISVFAIDADTVSMENNAELKGDSTFGKMLADAISEETDISSDYSVTAIEIADDQAVVTYNAVSDCTLLLAFYDEQTNEMYTYVSAEVDEYDKTATLNFNNGVLPDYFVAKAYLVNNKGAALCKEYVSYTYTKIFEESFTNTTVDDFDEDKIVNFDDSYVTNFAVIADTTEKIITDGSSNVLESNYLEDETYTFTNINSDMASLHTGDIFWYYTGNDEDVIIIKVKTIDIDGTTAVITADETSLDEVFDFVKIDESNDEYEMYFTPYYDESDENENENEVVESSQSLKAPRKIVDYDKEASISATYPFGKDGKGWKINENVKVTGSLSFTVGASVKVYYKSQWFQDNYLQIEVSISPKFKVDISLSAEMTDKVVKKIGDVSIPLCAGLYVEFTPAIAIKASAKIDISGTLTVKAGFEYNNLDGFVNKCESPSFKPEIKVEGEFFIGIDLTPHVCIIHEKVADAGITAEAGFEIKAETKTKSDTHSCLVCIDGDINFKIEVSAYVQFLNKFKPSAKIIDFSAKLADFYYSIDHLQFGWGECPYDTESGPAEFNGHYYKLYDETTSWWEANSKCQSLGGHLVTITSNEEQDFVSSLTTDMTRAMVWIGAVKSDSKWTWVTGEDWNYENWNIGENEPSGDGNYVQMITKLDGTHKLCIGAWNDKRNIKMPGDFWGDVGFICEWESYRDYKKNETQGGMGGRSSVPAKVTAFNDIFSKSLDATYLENAIIFKAEPKNIYMVYSVTDNNDVKYISQGTANDSGVVNTAFCKTVDTDTYAVGCFADEIDSFKLNISDHIHLYSEDIVPAGCTEDGYVVYTCSCGDNYTEIILAIGHKDNNNDGYCDNCNLDLDPQSHCSCNCHKSGIIKFFWKLINFLHKLFGMEQYHYCACGKNHW